MTMACFTRKDVGGSIPDEFVSEDEGKRRGTKGERWRELEEVL